MTIGFVTRSCQRLIGSVALICCLSMLLTFVSTSRADDENDKAINMLESLKRRSAEERWQRVKKLYPSDPPAPSRQTPTRLPEEHQNLLSEDELPPSPEQSPLIPRLSAVPYESSNDWVRPARQPVVGVDDALLDFVPNSPIPPSPVDAGSTNGRPAREAVRVAVQDIDPNTPTVDKIASVNSMRARDRKISDIDPYYDRTKDTDIREFATEKAKEFDILFRPKTYEERSFPNVTLAWEASNFYFYPLYFSDPALERYGHSYHPVIQPIASIARAGVQFVLLPYQMTILEPGKPESPLGYYRPGDCAPKLHYQIPLNAQAAVVEAAALTGLYFLIVQ